MRGILNETRTYNSMFQLTRITVPSVLDIQYAYPSQNNNGKLASQTDVISGEQITYTYDALNRLATAVTTDNPSVTQWGQSYTFDGFGNLTDQNVIKGSAPEMHVAYTAATNRQTTDTADLNGNIGSGYTYDLENRLLKAGAGMPQFGYDAGNKRIARDTEFTFWAGNQKRETYTTAVSGSSVTFTLTGVNVYFSGRLIAKGATHSGATSVAQDRLGSMNGKFYPFGQERPSATTNDKEKFTGYFRDAATGLDYADQRYHSPGVGRFMTPDPYKANGGGAGNLADPGSWNKYAYVSGDPVNRVDPWGLADCAVGQPLPCTNSVVEWQPYYLTIQEMESYLLLYGVQNTVTVTYQPTKLEKALATEAEGCTIGEAVMDECEFNIAGSSFAAIFAKKFSASVLRRVSVPTTIASLGWSAVVRWIGAQGEAIVQKATGLGKNTDKLQGIGRIPDMFDPTINRVVEVKNSSYVSMVAQLKDMMDWVAARPGATFELWVRRSATLSPTITKARDEGLLKIEYFDFP